MALLILVQSGIASASGSVPDGQSMAQQRVITDLVRESNGNALPSVSIQEKGTTNGVLTDGSG